MSTLTMAGLTARETWGRLASMGTPVGDIPRIMVEAWASGSKTTGGVLLHASGNSDGAENAHYRITEL